MKKKTHAEQILDELNIQTLTAEDLNFLTGISKSIIHRRLSDLWNKGLVCQTGRSFCSIDNAIQYAEYRIVKNSEIEEVIQKRKKMLFEDWLRQGYNNGRITLKQVAQIKEAIQ